MILSVGAILNQRTLTIGGRITVRLVSNFARMHWTASLNSNKIIFPSFVSSSLVKLETSRREREEREMKNKREREIKKKRERDRKCENKLKDLCREN